MASSQIIAQLSSIAANKDIAEKCIDGNTEISGKNLCHSSGHLAPWLAIRFPEPVEVTRVDLHNRGDCDPIHQCGARTKNLEVRLTDELPKSEKVMYTGGQLLGRFKGPGKDGEIIRVEG